MFERDKDELRELGIPLVTESLDACFDDELGYRIDRREYALPEITFEPDEVAVLGLASRAWAQASLAGPAAQALRKLHAAGRRDATSRRSSGIEPRLRTAEPAFEPVKTAVVDRAADPLRLPHRARRRGRRAARPAVGDRVLARPLVPHRLRPRPRRAPRLPAQPDRGAVVRRAARTGRTTCRRPRAARP